LAENPVVKRMHNNNQVSGHCRGEAATSCPAWAVELAQAAAMSQK
jgi:hypothetical protein